MPLTTLIIAVKHAREKSSDLWRRSRKLSKAFSSGGSSINGTLLAVSFNRPNKLFPDFFSTVLKEQTSLVSLTNSCSARSRTPKNPREIVSISGTM